MQSPEREFTKPVGFVGLGLMGQPMAMNLRRAGVALHVWNRTASKCAPLVEAGATAANTLDELFAACSTIILMLANETSTDIALGRREGGFARDLRGKRIIGMGTVSPAWSEELASDLRVNGAEYIEAPVSGSRQPAITAQLVAMIAGSTPNARSEVAELIAPMCRQTFDAGEIPSALKLKLCVNLYLITMVAGLTEATALADRLGIELALFRSVLDAGPMASDVSRMKLAKLAAQDLSAQAAIDDVLMNCRLVAAAAHDASFQAPLLSQAMRLFDNASLAGLGNSDMIGVIRALEVSGSTERQIVAEQLDAYNQRDLERFMTCWHPDAIIATHPDQVLLRGADEIGDHHRRRFEDAALRALLLSRTNVGNVVVDHEWVTRSGVNGPEHFEVLGIYTVTGDKIAHASFRQVERLARPDRVRTPS